MGVLRKYAPHRRWSDSEVAALRAHYATAPHDDLLAALPGRTLRIIQCKANGLGLVRQRPAKRTADETRAAKREIMAKRRAADPDAARDYQRRNYWANRDTRLAVMKEYQRRRFFWLRASKLKSDVSATDLARLWKQQRGLCALTGRRLNRENAHLDHITAKARGGNDAIVNLRWVCTEANLAKRELSDAEFVALCSDVMRWIGERIAMVEAMTQQQDKAA